MPSTALAVAGSTAAAGGDVGGGDLTGPAIVSGFCSSAGSSSRSLWTPSPEEPSFSESDMTGDQRGIIWALMRAECGGWRRGMRSRPTVDPGRMQRRRDEASNEKGETGGDEQRGRSEPMFLKPTSGQSRVQEATRSKR
jgi:hypothetical protein